MHYMQNKYFKRWLCSLLFLCSFVVAQTQSLKKVEYFFDTDPGVGNGLSIIIPASPSFLDSTFTFNVSSLANGLHTIYIRVQDDSLKWSLNNAFSFIKTSGSGGVLVVQKLEYFFDTDPGVGNGTTLNVLQNNTVDSTFAFNISTLSNGLHVIYVRAMDANGNYSLNYASSFVKSIGIDSVLTVNKLEYFLDTDPGFGNGFNIPIQEAPIINDTFNFPIPDNGADSRRLYIRAKDNKGQWSLLYDNTVDLCQLYKAQPNFSWIRFADSYSFIDSTKNNPTHKLFWNFDNLGIDSVSNPQFTFPQGYHSVTLAAGTGCRTNVVTLPLYTGLEKYYPDSAMAGGDITMLFYGGGLDTNLVVTLKNGSTNITSYEKVAYMQKAFAGVFDLHTAQAGTYDVNLHFHNGFDTTIISGLKVSPAPSGNYSPEITVSVEGPFVARAGSVVTHHLIITNNGGMMAKSIPVWSAAQNNVNYTPSQGYGNYVSPDSLMDYQDSIPTEIGMDSLYGNQFNGKLHNFIIPSLNAGQSYVYSYTLQVPNNHGETNYIYFWNGKRMYGSPFSWDCIHAALDVGFNLAGLIPVVGCGFGLAGWGVDLASGLLGQLRLNNDRSYDNLGNIMYGAASAAWGCLPGVKTAQAAGRVAVFTAQAMNNSKRVLDIGKAAIDNTNANNGDPCDDENDPNKPRRWRLKDGVSADPNGIDGPQGFGTTDYLDGKGKQGYRIYFENLPTATANAQRIYLADTLDKTKFDLSSFELLGFNIADSFITIPFQRKEYTTTIDLRPKMNLQLRFNAKLDTATGILNCSYLSLDPLTRDTLPAFDLRGFLPPDTNGVSGTGSLLYGVNFKKSITTNTIVTNKGSIIFDNNAPILTNTWLNNIDKTAPTGGVSSGLKLNDTTVRLSFSGTDIGVGISRYKLYGAENNKPFVLLGNVSSDTLRFTGALDSVYKFYAVPYDSVGNFTPKAPVAEYTIIFSRPLSVNLISFTAQKLNADVQTAWQTAIQLNFDHYEVERSLDGNNFTKVATVQAVSGTGILNYQFKDLNAVNIYQTNGRLFYRLKMIDKDRTSSYSRIVRVDFDKKYTVEIYPNPAHDEINIEGVQNYKNIQVSDASGRIVYQQNINQTKQTLNISHLQNGIYIIKLIGNDDIQSLKFLKK